MAMTPLQSVLWDVKQRIENDKKLSKLRQKVNSGKATYADTAAYSTHVGNLLGDTFAQHILSVSPELREALTVELLHDRYMDINAIIDRVQKSMDEAQGLHLAPQHSPFYDDRAHQIGSALADPTVPDETIKRRARAATATATKSMHDDRMKSEAKFRSRAGLKCFITRVAVNGCCKWCAKLAGRYEYGEEPEEVYHRHDNCDCTVTYENGRQRQDVWSKREWEVPAKDAGAPEPVRLTAEQAAAKEAEHLPKRLTPGAGSGILKLTKISDSGSVLDPMNIELYNRMKSNLERRGCSVIAALHGSDDERFLLMFGAEAIADENGIMHLGEVPSASAFFEEIIHYTQIKKYGSMSSTDFIERDAREIAANRKLLKHGKNYGFSENDFSEIRNNLMQWEESFKRRVGVSYDESDIKREI